MKKKLAILLIGIISLGMILVGCSNQTPTDVVNSYFEQLKNGDNEEANKFIESTISQTEETSDEEEADGAMEEALKLYVSKIDAKVTSEEIDGDKATVEVELKGPNFSNIFLEVIQESIASAFSGEEMSEEAMNQSMMEKIKEGKIEDRTGIINLTKEDKEWKIKSDDDILALIIGNATSEDATLSK